MTNKRKSTEDLKEGSKLIRSSGTEESKRLWIPSKELLDTSHWTKFLEFVNDNYSTKLKLPSQLWEWSVENIDRFWDATWKYTGIKSSKPYSKVIDDSSKMPGAKFFCGSLLNFAENLLRFRDDRIAIIFKAETNSGASKITYNELYSRVACLAAQLSKFGIKSGDRVVSYSPNIPETIIAMLAATSIGAVWSSCSPDFGPQGVLDRFRQISPKILFTTDGYFYKGNRIDTFPQLKEIVENLPTLQKVIVFRYTIQVNLDLDLARIRHGEYYDSFVNCQGCCHADSMVFTQLPFHHPVYVMYSSGTTGLPKCIVQGPGVLLNHLKELIIHLNISRNDKVFFYTTTGWMMWNWLVSSLAVGATVVLFDGNPLYPNVKALWQYAEETKITFFGTSARYLAAVMDSGSKPGREFDLSKLRILASTGSPATSNIFKFVHNDIKSDVQFVSMSGGTDLNGCFALGCSNLPVYEDEIQIRGLGLDVRIFNDDGKEVIEEKGELVCLKPFPSMPLYFWDDKDKKKYLGAYFETFPNIWRHGDYAEVTKHGGIIIYGRSDATLNPGGVRIGTADIYKVIETVPEVEDSIVIGQDYLLNDGTPDVRVLLFVVMRKGNNCSTTFKKDICKVIRDQTSPRHVPSFIIPCPDIPYTVSGKKVELSVKKIMNGKSVTNRSALKNPESLDWFQQYYSSQLTLKN